MQIQKNFNNLKYNWYFPVSAAAYFLLGALPAQKYYIQMALAVIILMVIASYLPSQWEYLQKISLKKKMYVLFSAAGICMHNASYFQTQWSASEKVKMISDMLPGQIDVSLVIGIIGSIFAFPFVFLIISMILSKIEEIFRLNNPLEDNTKPENIIYFVMLSISFAAVNLIFSRSYTFYRGFMDVIYTSDSAILTPNAFLAFTHPENDLRQPLFAIFALPFTGISYFVGRMLTASSRIQALLLMYPQLVLLFLSNFMVAKTLKLSSAQRVCFIVFTFCCYPYLLFSVMMEQYIFAYFWITLLLYSVCVNRKPSQTALWGAGGSLLTSLAFTLLMSGHSPIHKFKEWFLDMFRQGIAFLILILAACRLDIITNLYKGVSFLNQFAGEKLTLWQKFEQYTIFVKSCFFAPETCIMPNATEDISWQLASDYSISFVGVAILVLMIVSVIINRDKKITRIAACWGLFSIILLVVLGWGTAENGLILYALYFAWAFWVLAFQLIQKLGEKLHSKYVAPVGSLTLAAVVLVINLPAMLEMLQFAVTHYPA